MSYSPSQNKVNMHRNNVCVGQTTANNQFSYSYDFFSVWMSFLILICKFSLHPSLSYISTFWQLSGHSCLKPYPRLQISISIMEAYYLHYQTWSSPNDFFFFLINNITSLPGQRLLSSVLQFFSLSLLPSPPMSCGICGSDGGDNNENQNVYNFLEFI